MNILFDRERLGQLMESLQTMTGIRAEIYDANWNPVWLSRKNAPFCALIQSSPEGQARCLDCGRKMAGEGTQFCRCHGGVCGGILPIRQGSVTLAYVLYGQVLDESGLKNQWERAREGLGWYSGDLDALGRAFFRLRRLSRREQEACAQIMEAMTGYISLKGIIHSSEQTDLQRLEEYLDRHYTEKLSLDAIAAALGMGRTRLCALARQYSGEGTVSRMIAQRRIAAAKELLLQTDSPVSAVAEAVGVSDYNYFTKIFRTATGRTPSAFRREGRQP